MTTRSADPSARRSLDASPCRPLRTAAGGSSPHSASTSCSVGTTRPTCRASMARARAASPATVTSGSSSSSTSSSPSNPMCMGRRYRRIGGPSVRGQLTSAAGRTVRPGDTRQRTPTPSVRRPVARRRVPAVNAIESAPLAVVASEAATAGADAHLQGESEAHGGGATARSSRSPVGGGGDRRAAGLALEHPAEFLGDAALLSGVAPS